MYRIELSPGEETAFRTIEELAVAIRRGVVTSKARIWHNASGKWLPIQFHPHYKTAAAMPLTNADLVAGPPVTPLSALNIPDPNAPPRVTGFRPVDPLAQSEVAAPVSRAAPLKPASPYHQPEPPVPPSPAAGLPLIEPLGSTSQPAPVRKEPARTLKPVPALKLPAQVEAPARKPRQKARRKSGRRALRAALVGALLIGGGHLALSAGTKLRNDGLRSYRRLVAAPPEAVQWDSPRTVATVIPALGASPVPGSMRTPAAPPVRTPATGPVTQASLPALMPPAIDTAVAIEAAPAVDIPVPIPSAADSLSSNKPDSSGKKVLKGILKAVSGTAAGTQQRPKR